MSRWGTTVALRTTRGHLWLARYKLRGGDILRAWCELEAAAKAWEERKNLENPRFIGTIWSIYVLRDPRTLEVRYVGCTRDPRKRLMGHLNLRNVVPARAAWLGELRSLGLHPQLEVVACTRGWRPADGQAIETTVARQYEAAGAHLLGKTESFAAGIARGLQETRARVANLRSRNY